VGCGLVELPFGRHFFLLDLWSLIAYNIVVSMKKVGSPEKVAPVVEGGRNLDEPTIEPSEKDKELLESHLRNVSGGTNEEIGEILPKVIAAYQRYMVPGASSDYESEAEARVQGRFKELWGEFKAQALEKGPKRQRREKLEKQDLKDFPSGQLVTHFVAGVALAIDLGWFDAETLGEEVRAKAIVDRIRQAPREWVARNRKREIEQRAEKVRRRKEEEAQQRKEARRRELNRIKDRVTLVPEGTIDRFRLKVGGLNGLDVDGLRKWGDQMSPRVRVLTAKEAAGAKTPPWLEKEGPAEIKTLLIIGSTNETVHGEACEFARKFVETFEDVRVLIVEEPRQEGKAQPRQKKRSFGKKRRRRRR